MREYSVLMSVYAKEKPEFLRQSMQSILSQTVPTNDFILVCDGPLTPELDAVIAQEAEQLGDTLNLVRLKENSGLGVALSEGMKCCKNELVARMDSDDISRPDRCEKQLALFEKYPELKLASGQLVEFVETPEKPTGKREVPLNHEQILAFSRKRNPMNHPCVMFCRSAAEAAGGYDEKYHLFEDYHLWIRMLQNGAQAKNLPDVLLDMRTPFDQYDRRGGSRYAADMFKFHWWMHKTGWTSLADFCTGAIPHALVCILPNGARKAVYRVLH